MLPKKVKGKGTTDKTTDIEKKLEYLGLDLDNIPEEITDFEPLEFRIPKVYDEKQYKQYRYIPISDIEILLSPTNRLDEIEDKYRKASPLADYLDSKSEKNAMKYNTFLRMLKELRIEDVEKVQEEQANLNRLIPFKVKYEGNYLWQIYYSENTDRYFMLVPTGEADYSTFFFLLKEKLNGIKAGKVFVPIRNVEYSNKYLKRSEFEEIENYLFLFTNNWPLIYEVYDKNKNLSIRIVGETEVYGKVKSQYRIKLKDQEEAIKFYKVLKAMFVLQTELPNYFKFRTDIAKNGSIDFYIEDRKIEYKDIADWIKEEYKVGIQKIQEANELMETNTKKLQDLKAEVSAQEIEYLAKEKQISTFLECKKTFFGKFKYYFKYSKKGNKSKNLKQQVVMKKNKKDENDEEELTAKNTTQDITVIEDTKSNYTIEELIDEYKEYETEESKLKDLLMDINALKLKKKNMQKKIENATNFINEIDSHKKSIFEFWRYSNKDEMSSLPEGEEEEINIIKKITKVFDYENDLEKFGKAMDKLQRKALSKDETDSVFIASTNVLPILNKVKNNEVLPKEIETNLKELKKEAIDSKLYLADDFDIFGGMTRDFARVSEINNQQHREVKKDKYTILDINKNTKSIGYKLTLEKICENIKKALEKVQITDDLPVYMAINGGKISKQDFNVFNINPEKEIAQAVKGEKNRINLYKINLKRGVNAISFTNCIFYDNQNKTLPLGQDLSTNILVDISKLKLKLISKTNFKMIHYEEENNDFSKIALKTVNVLEYDVEEDT